MNPRFLCKEIVRILYSRFEGGTSSHDQDNSFESRTNNVEVSRNDPSRGIGHVDEWAAKRIEMSPANTPTRSSARSTIKNEVIAYRAEVVGRRFTASESRLFWVEARKHNKYPNIGRLARLFLTVPASAILQERQFSELKRRCDSFDSRSNIENLGRDAVVYSWMDSTHSSPLTNITSTARSFKYS